jgi:hypothetical protein
MSSAERAVALLVGILTVISLMGAGLAILVRISMRTGQLVERLDSHIDNQDRRDQAIDRQFESTDRRLLWLEQRRRRV